MLFGRPTAAEAGRQIPFIRSLHMPLSMRSPRQRLWFAALLTASLLALLRAWLPETPPSFVPPDPWLGFRLCALLFPPVAILLATAAMPLKKPQAPFAFITATFLGLVIAFLVVAFGALATEEELEQRLRIGVYCYFFAIVAIAVCLVVSRLIERSSRGASPL